MKLHLLFICLFLLSLSAFGQVTTSSSGARNIAPEKTSGEKVNQIISDSGNLFKEGLLNLLNDRRSRAREKFDKSVEVFLISSAVLNENIKLLSCYSILVETVYRLEFPTPTGQPQIEGLALTCGWNIDASLIGSVKRITQNSSKNTGNLIDKDNETLQAFIGNQPGILQRGFTEQHFEPSPLDELSKLELTGEKQKAVSSPKNRVQYNRTFSAGEKPRQSADGKVPVVMNYFNEVLNDPYSMKFVRWTKVELHNSCRDGKSCWRVGVKYRAKNTFGAYVLTEGTFDVRNNKIIYRTDGAILPAVKPTAGESLRDVANRTGIPTEQLQRINGGEIPRDGKIIIPVNRERITNVVRPGLPYPTKKIQSVISQSGDTIAKIAARFGVPAIEVAKFNGLSAVNTPLPVGREIRIPVRY